MPASRSMALPERLNSRSNTARADVVQVVAGATGVQIAGTLIITSFVLPAAIKRSLCTLGTPGETLPSSAMIEKPLILEVVVPTACEVSDPTIEGTCMREPAFTNRTKTFPPGVSPVAGLTANNEDAALVRLNATP